MWPPWEFTSHSAAIHGTDKLTKIIKNLSIYLFAILTKDMLLFQVWGWLKSSGLEPTTACLNAYVLALGSTVGLLLINSIS